MVVGTFENHQYDTNGKNKWHYVTITYNEASNTYTWKNRAGFSWTLSSTINSNQLRVHEDYPYFKTGDKIYFYFTQMGIYGRGNEFYMKKGTFFILFGTLKSLVNPSLHMTLEFFCVKTLK